MNVITKTVSLPDGRTISIETGKLAKQADGAVMLRMNNTVLLATVCGAKDAVPGTDFMPLQVEYREKYSAAGRFPGGFTKREGKANDDEILTCRLVDRALRPLFPSDYHAEVYVNVILYSADGVDMPDALAGFAASAALSCSDIPFDGPISEVRVARINGEYVINPTFAQLAKADMDLMVGATEENIMMVEGEMKEVSEQDLLGALKAAHEAIKPMCQLQKELAKELGTDVKREYCHEVNDEELREQVKTACYQPAYDVTKQALEKHARAEAFEKIREDFKLEYAAAHPELSDDELNVVAGGKSCYCAAGGGGTGLCRGGGAMDDAGTVAGGGVYTGTVGVNCCGMGREEWCCSAKSLARSSCSLIMALSLCTSCADMASSASLWDSVLT